MVKLFLVLAIAWAANGAYRFAAMQGDPERLRAVGSSALMALFNLGAALFLYWLKQRRGRRDD